MSRQISTISALALVALALFVVGCGGSDDDDGSSSSGGDTSLAKSEESPPTKAEFIKEAEAICDKSNDTRFNEAVKYRKEFEKELEAMEPIPREEKIISAVVLPSV